MHTFTIWVSDKDAVRSLRLVASEAMPIRDNLYDKDKETKWQTTVTYPW